MSPSRSSPRHVGALAVLLVALASGDACLPVDTRPAPGSILLVATSADQPSTTTADGWAIAIDRLLVGIGGADAGHNSKCHRYTETNYLRLLDGRLAKDQKVAIVYGLGQCDFTFVTFWPSSETVLGEGVSEADRDVMKGSGLEGPPGPRQEGIVVDFAATATRGDETKRVHWTFSQRTPYGACVRAAPGASKQPLELRSDENITLRVGIRGVALFADDANPETAVLRFDPIAWADGAGADLGVPDGVVTLAELRDVTLDVARQSGGSYAVGSDVRGTPHSLRDYIRLVLLPQLVTFPEDIVCIPNMGFGGPPPR